MAIDLQAFCDNECDSGLSSRYALHRPWSVTLDIVGKHGGKIVGEFGIATDGRIMVASDQPVPWQLEDVKRPRVEVAFENFPCHIKHYGRGGWYRIPKKLPKCKTCRGIGYHLCCCEVCGYEHRGDLCDRCCTKLGSKRIQRRMMNLILKLPNCRWIDTDGDPKSILWLAFDGGFGAVMPIIDLNKK